MGHTSTVLESFPTVVGNGILGVVCETTEHQVAADKGAGTSFAGVAVDVDDVLGVSLHELVYLLTCFGQQNQGRAMVIFPIIIVHLIFERRLVILPSTQIIDPKLVAMILFNETRNILNVVSVHFLEEVGGWEAHGVNTWCDSCQIEVKVSILISYPRT